MKKERERGGMKEEKEGGKMSEVVRGVERGEGKGVIKEKQREKSS